MSKDITPELLANIQKDFQRSIEQSVRIRELNRLLESGKATYKEANEYAILIGEFLAEAFERHISSNVLPDGRMYFNIADRILRSTLGVNHKLITEYSAEVQAALNRQAGIGIKAIQPKINEDRIQGLIQRVSQEESFDEVAWVLQEPIINFSQSIIDEVIRANADFQYRAGLSPVIIRRAASKCCKWCDNLAGTYNYEAVKNTGNDVFRRHRFCRCTVEYDPRDGSAKRNVHTHQNLGSKEDMEARKALYQKQVEQQRKESEKRQKDRIARAKQEEEEQKLAEKERRERRIQMAQDNR